MLGKLALRNTKRSIKDYIIYLITVILSFSFIFALNLISFSKDITELGDMMSNFKFAIIAVNIFVIAVIGFLINYTTRFMFNKRSREFGMYMLLGIKKSKIKKMFLTENVILGLLSFAVAIPCGFLFSQLMSLIIMNIFDMPYKVSMNFSGKPLLLSFVYFLIVYTLVLPLSLRRLSKMKVYDLLYLDKQNEKHLKIKSVKLSSVLFAGFSALGIVSLIIFDGQFSKHDGDPNFSVILLSAALLIISIYGVMLNFSSTVLKLILRSDKQKFKGDNLFVARCFSAKLRAMSVTVGTLTVLVAFTLIALNISGMFKGMADFSTNLTAPYDISISNQENYDDYISFIDKDYHITQKIIYPIYITARSGKRNVGKYEDENSDCVMALGDYNKLLSMRGLKKASLKNNEYLIASIRNYEKSFADDKELESIKLSNGINLKRKEVVSQNYCLSWADSGTYIFVVPDNAVMGLKTDETHLVINTKKETSEKLYKKISDMMVPETGTLENGDSFEYIGGLTVKGKILQENRGLVTITAFLCYYIAFIFIAAVGTILAIQSLSDSAKYKYRYTVLSRLGVRDKKIYKTIRKQLLWIFGCPIVFPIIASFFVSFSMNRIFKMSLTSDWAFIIYFFAAIAVFLLVYSVYFVATYFGFKKNISE